MAKVVWSVPLLQYGKFLIEADEDELGVDVSSPYEMGMAYAIYAQLAAKGYDAGLKIDVGLMIEEPKAPDVTGQYQESSEPMSSDAIAETLIKDQLGATTVEPWTKTPESSTTKRKAWEDFDI